MSRDYMFKNNDLFSFNSIRVTCSIEGAKRFRIYVWEPLYKIAELMGVKGLELVTECVDSDDCLKTHIAYNNKIREVYAKYSEWCGYRNDFISGKIDTVLPFFDDNLIEYWKTFFELFYVNSYTRFDTVFKEMRSMLDNADMFSDSVNEELRKGINKMLNVAATDTETITYICNEAYCNIDMYGKVYWWMIPYINTEKTIEDVMNGVTIGKYDVYLPYNEIFVD